MAFYKTCSRCGANLDPGEPCDCEQEEEKMRKRYAQSTKEDSKTGQLTFMFGRKDDSYAATGIY